MSPTNYPIPLDPEIAAFVGTLNDDAREYFEERAGIAEFEAGMTKAAAEQFALELTRAHFQLQK
ncbi:MAG: hypothetical protein Q7U57_19495 [Methylovulum sp.]|nr:hypothetical protein [Methylovulum sp.]